jgi:hypothetical protein
VSKSTKTKNEEPGLSITPVEVKSGEGDDKEKENSVGKYSAITKGVSEEELPYRFINDIREKRTDEQKPYVYLF